MIHWIFRVQCRLRCSGGPWSANAPDAIDHLIAAGYPTEKLFYYQGSMQAWAHAGLTIQ
jgi:hypothetical protein